MVIPVGSAEFRSAGDRNLPAESGDQDDPHPDAPANPDALAQAELLMSFLTDFHAAGREPPKPKPGPGQPDAGVDRPLPDRFATFVPAASLDFYEVDAVPAAVLPVWPPPPSELPLPAPEPRVSGPAPEADGPRRQPRFRLGRRG